MIGIAEAPDCAPRDFAEVVRPARALGEIAAHILDKALLLEELEQRNRVLHAIVALGERANQTSEPSGLAQFVAERLTDVLGATCCEIFKIERGQLRCLVSLDVRPGCDDPTALKPVEMSEFPSLEGPRRPATCWCLPATTTRASPSVSARSTGAGTSAANRPSRSSATTVWSASSTSSTSARDCAEHLDLGGPERGLTVSVGVATFPDDAVLMEELVDKADGAMYLAKRQGRDRVMPFGPSAREQPIEAPAAT